MRLLPSDQGFVGSQGPNPAVCWGGRGLCVAGLQPIRHRRGLTRAGRSVVVPVGAGGEWRLLAAPRSGVGLLHLGWMLAGRVQVANVASLHARGRVVALAVALSCVAYVMLPVLTEYDERCLRWVQGCCAVKPHAGVGNMGDHLCMRGMCCQATPWHVGQSMFLLV